MALNQFGAGFTLTGRDMASPVVNRVATSFTGLQRSVQSGAAGMNKAMGSLAIGFASLKLGQGLAGIGVASADAAGKFEEGLAGIAAVSRATSDEQIMLHDKALRSAMASQFSPDEAVQGLTNLATAGLKAREQIEVLDPVLNLAAGSMGQLGLGEAANAVVGTLKSMAFEVKDATIVTDKLLKITQLTNFQARDFAIGLARATSTAKLYGQSLDDTLIQMGLLRNLNIEASVASTSLREAWRRLASDQKSQQAVMEQGVTIFDEQTGKIRPLMDVMGDLATKTKDLTDKERMRMATQAFGVRGMAAFNAVAEARNTIMVDGIAVTLEGADAIASLRKEMEESSGVAEEFKQKLLDTYEGQKKLIGGAKEALAVVTGEAAAKLFKPVAAVIFDFISGLAELMNSIPTEARQVIIGVVTALGSLIAMAGGILLFQGVMNMLGLSFGGVAITLGKFLAIGIPVMVLMSGLAVGAYALYRAFSQNAGGIGTSWEEMVTKIKVGWQVIMAVVKGDDIGEELQKQIEDAGMEGFLTRFTNFWERIQSLWEGIKKGFEIGVLALADSPAFIKLKDTIKGVLELFTGTEMGNSQEALDDWKDKGETAGMKLASLGESAATALTKLIELGKGFLNFISDMDGSDVTGKIDGFVDSFNTLADALHAIKTLVKVIVNAFMTIPAAIGETLAAFGHLFEALGTLPKAFTTKQMDVWADHYKRTFASGSAFESTLGFARGAAEAVDERFAYVANARQSERARGTRETSAADRITNLTNLRARKKNIEEWVNLSINEWRSKTRGTESEGNLAFGEMGRGAQNQWLEELVKISKGIEKLSNQKPVINVDGELLGRVTAESSAFTGEDGLDDVEVMPVVY